MNFDVFKGLDEFINKTLSTERHRAGRALLIIRPYGVSPEDPNIQIVHKIVRPDGVEALWLCRI
jgi:hypothetical protein